MAQVLEADNSKLQKTGHFYFALTGRTKTGGPKTGLQHCFAGFLQPSGAA
jgi:hypothetical protein